MASRIKLKATADSGPRNREYEVWTDLDNTYQMAGRIWNYGSGWEWERTWPPLIPETILLLPNTTGGYCPTRENAVILLENSLRDAERCVRSWRKELNWISLA